MDSLKKIINEIFFVDINDKTRKRRIVDARRAYSKILRDVGFSYEHIGDSIDKDHATIIHYAKSINDLLQYDSIFEKKFILAKKQFLLENKQLIPKSNDDIYTTAIKLGERVEEITLEKQQMLNKFVDYLESYEKENGITPSIEYCRKSILPLFDS
jgi:hypothetical protein